ncbi:MAG: Flp pilus assembly complex ATPase component TadA [Phycisphaerales bacterium]|nr:Flp pilus assembly complex ATPase component TadA [Phycisphaerales bacterium]
MNFSDLTTNAGPMWTLAASAGDPLMLVSVWKPLVFLAVLGGWGWIVSTRFDKHAAKYFLPRQKWNLVHLSIGLVALLVGLFMPVPDIAGFLAGLGAMIALLIADIIIYMVVSGKDERVPAEHRITLGNLISGGMVKEKVKVDPTLASQGKTVLKLFAPDKSLVRAPGPNTPELALWNASEDVLVKAFDARATQVEIQPASGGQYESVALVDGIRTPLATMAPPDAAKVMDFWKSAAKLDLADRRKKLSNLINVERGSERKPVRVTSQGTAQGMRLQLLIDPENQVKRKAEALGFLDEQMAVMKEMTTSTKGLALLAALPDGGRTTLFYGVLGMHDAYTQTVQSMEMEVQHNLEGVRHQAFDPNIDGADYATQTRSMLRRDPNVMGVAEIPDAPTAKEVAKADFARCRVYAMVRAGSVIEALDGWLKAVGDPELASKNLQYVVAERLMRKLCTNCRVPYPASPDLLAKLGVAPGQKGPEQLYKKGGQVMVKNRPETCPMCRGTGYYEQTGVFEVAVIGEEERDMLAQGNVAAVRASLKKKGMISIQGSAIRKALSGVTSVEEVMRLTAPAAAPAPAAAKA